MNQRSKLNSQEKNEEQLASTQQSQQSGGLEFGSPEEMLRHDALHTPVPPAIAFRLKESLGEQSSRNLSWWRRMFGA